MKLQNPPGSYSPRYDLERNRQLEAADRQNLKRGKDIEVGPGRLILTAPNGTRYAVSVDNTGALTTDAL